jgi:hypothetical protein
MAMVAIVAAALPACTSSASHHVAQPKPPPATTPSPSTSASGCAVFGKQPAATRTWVTASGPPAFTITDVHYGGVELAGEWIGGTSAAPRYESVELSGAVRCPLAVLADLSRVPLDVVTPGAPEARHQHAIHVDVNGDMLTMTFARGSQPQRLEFRPGPATAYLARVAALRRAAGVTALDVGLVRSTLAHVGFTLDAPISPWTEPQFPSPFRAVHGTCTGSGDGACQHNFFFFGNRYLGTDTAGIQGGVYVAWQSRGTVALAYLVWRAGDAMCCPSGAVRVVRFHWNGSRVVALDRIPD